MIHMSNVPEKICANSYAEKKGQSWSVFSMNELQVKWARVGRPGRCQVGRYRVMYRYAWGSWRWVGMDGTGVTHSGSPLVRGGDCYSTVVTKGWVKKLVCLWIGNRVPFIVIEAWGNQIYCIHVNLSRHSEGEVEVRLSIMGKGNRELWQWP